MSKQGLLRTLAWRLGKHYVALLSAVNLPLLSVPCEAFSQTKRMSAFLASSLPNLRLLDKYQASSACCWISLAMSIVKVIGTSIHSRSVQPIARCNVEPCRLHDWQLDAYNECRCSGLTVLV